jgi:hypothetical protein
MSQRLTKRLVDRIQPNGKDTSYRDGMLPGLELRVKPSGTKSYCIRYRNQSGRLVRETLGQRAIITLEQAREIAQKRLAQVTRTRARGAEIEPKVETVAELASPYVQEYSRQHHKPDTQASYRHLLRRYILPDLGHLRIDSLARRGIATWHRQHSRRSPTQGTILSWGERRESPGNHPLPLRRQPSAFSPWAALNRRAQPLTCSTLLAANMRDVTINSVQGGNRLK